MIDHGLCRDQNWTSLDSWSIMKLYKRNYLWESQQISQILRLLCTIFLGFSTLYIRSQTLLNEQDLSHIIETKPLKFLLCSWEENEVFPLDSWSVSWSKILDPYTGKYYIFGSCIRVLNHCDPWNLEKQSLHKGFIDFHQAKSSLKLLDDIGIFTYWEATYLHQKSSY